MPILIGNKRSISMIAGQPETGTKPSVAPASESNVYADLAQMAASQGEGPAVDEAPEAADPSIGRAEEIGAGIGRKIDNLAERGSDAVATGRDKVSDGLDKAADKAYEVAGKIDGGIKSIKERAKNVRERVKDGAELAGEKRKEAVAAAKDKSKKAMLITIGASIVAGEAIASAPEKVAAKGRKIGETLNRWASKAMEKISGRAKKTKETISGAILGAAEKVGDVVESGIDRVDDKLKNWEAKLQAARKEAEEAAEKARVEAMTKAYVEARVEEAKNQANKAYDTKVAAAAEERDEAIDGAMNTAEREIAGLTSEQIGARMADLGKEDLVEASSVPAEVPAAVTPEAPAEIPPATSAAGATPEVMPTAA